MTPEVILVHCFTTTWDYTTLKLDLESKNVNACFTTTWDYTTLKQEKLPITRGLCFTTTWDYTTLKLGVLVLMLLGMFYYHLGLHYSQTSGTG